MTTLIIQLVFNNIMICEFEHVLAITLTVAMLFVAFLQIDPITNLSTPLELAFALRSQWMDISSNYIALS